MNALLHQKNMKGADLRLGWRWLACRGLADRSFTDEDIVGIYTSQVRIIYKKSYKQLKSLVSDA
jgi:hypothetical protein